MNRDGLLTPDARWLMAAGAIVSVHRVKDLYGLAHFRSCRRMRKKESGVVPEIQLKTTDAECATHTNALLEPHEVSGSKNVSMYGECVTAC